MPKGDGDPPNQHLIDETQRVPPSKRQLRDFFGSLGCTRPESERLIKILEKSGTTVTPRTVLTRTKSQRKLAAPLELKALPPPPAPQALTPPSAPVSDPESPPTTSRTVARSWSIGTWVKYRSIEHVEGYDLWGPLRTTFGYVRPLLRSRVIAIAAAAVGFDSAISPLNDAAALGEPPPAETYSLPEAPKVAPQPRKPRYRCWFFGWHPCK
jgi:hypothetical protein